MQNQLINTINVKKLVLNKLKTPSILAIIVILFFTLFTFKYWLTWGEGHPFHNDVDQYYSYLVAQFIHHDLSFKMPHAYWLIEAPNHQLVPKVTMGIALLNLPFFVLADNIAYIFDFDPLGYSAPYAWCIHFGTLLYVLIGLWYIRKSLLIFFNEWVTALTIILILFGTNLFYYTYRETEMSHSYLFFLFSIFFYHSIKWHFTQKNKHLYFLSFIAGFVALIRPTEVIILIIPLLYHITSLSSAKLKLNQIIALKWRWLIVISLFILPIIPQLLFWKMQTGQFLFFSYGSSEGFFFTDPKIYSVLFGWRKGWFIYTPIMIFIVIGLILMYQKWKNMFWAIFIYLLLNLYLVSSWWDWGFGGACGMRALVQCYAFLSFPLAFFINWVFTLKRKKVKAVLIPITMVIFGLCIYLSILQTWLFKNSLMHWDSMTKKAYFYAVSKPDEIDRVYLETLFVHPNYDDMRKGKRDE